MPTRTQVLQVIGDRCDYDRAATRLGIPAGQLYMVATGLPADGGDTFPPDEHLNRPGILDTSTQHLVYRFEVVNSTQKPHVHDWIRRRAEADTQMRESARARDAEPAEPEDTDDTDVCHILTRQHDRVTALMQQLKAIPGVSKGGSEVHQSRRKSIVDMVTMELSKHETAEQEHFWPKVRRFFENGDELVDHALEQEQEGAESLVGLGNTDASEKKFDELTEELEEKLRKHVSYEEQILLSLRDNMDDEERQAIGRRIQRAEKNAPTRPHPHAPKEPGTVVKAAAASAAPLDKARDALGGRPAKRRGRAENEPESPTEEDR